MSEDIRDAALLYIVLMEKLCHIWYLKSLLLLIIILLYYYSLWSVLGG